MTNISKQPHDFLHVLHDCAEALDALSLRASHWTEALSDQRSAVQRA